MIKKDATNGQVDDFEINGSRLNDTTTKRTGMHIQSQTRDIITMARSDILGSYEGKTCRIIPPHALAPNIALKTVGHQYVHATES